MPDLQPDSSSTAVADAPAPVQPSTADVAQQNIPTPDAAPATSPDAGSSQPPQWTALASSVLGNSSTESGQPTTPPPSTVTQVQRPPDALSQHPAVVKASIMHRIAETLAGGPKIRTTYGDDGSVTREPVPLSNHEILSGAIANILGGIANTGQGYLAGRQGRPVQSQPLPTQAAAQQAATQSKEDFDQKQVGIIRALKVREANLNAFSAKLAAGKESYETLKSMADNRNDEYDSNKDAGNIVQDGVRDSELPALIQSGKLDKDKHNAIPHGVPVPVYGPDGKQVEDANGVPMYEHLNAIIDGTRQVQATPETLQRLADYGLLTGNVASLQGADGKIKNPQTMSAATINNLNHQADLLDQTASEFKEVNPGFDIKAAIKADPSFLSDVKKMHLDGASQNLNDQLNKVGQQFPEVANRMRAAIGPDALKAYQAKTQTAGDLTHDKALSIISDPATDKTSAAYSKAQTFLKQENIAAGNKKAVEESVTNPAGGGLEVPKGFALNPNAMEMDPTSLQSDLVKQGVKVPANYQALYAVGHNAADLKTLPTRTSKGTNQMDAQTGLAFIRQYINPNYQEGDYSAAAGLSKELASTKQGTAGGSLLSAGVASNHLAMLDDAATALKNNDTQGLNALANTLGVQLGKSPAVTFKAIADQVNAEVGKVVAGGTPHEAELAKLAQNLNTDQSPEQVQNVIKAYVNLMSGRVNEINERSQQYFGRDVKGVSPAVAKTFAKYGVIAPGYVQVKVNGAPGVIPKSNLPAFKKQYPNAEVQQ